MSAPAEFGIGVSSHGFPWARRRSHAPDRDEFDRWAEKHTPAVFRLALRLTRSRTDAEDLVQETFLRAWKGIRKFRGEAGLKTWLIRILVNTAHSLRRRAPPPAVGEMAGGPSRDPADALGRRDLLHRVLAAIHGLPRRQREALLLRACGGLSYREIAETMAVKRTAVKSHLVKARRRLLRRFGREMEEWGLTDR